MHLSYVQKVYTNLPDIAYLHTHNRLWVKEILLLENYIFIYLVSIALVFSENSTKIAVECKQAAEKL